MKEVKLWGYTIYEDGTILGVYGKKMAYNSQVSVKWGITKENKMVSYARFVYYAFNFKTFNYHDKTIIILHKDGNKKNCAIDNLVAKKRKMIHQGENNRSAKLTDKEVEEIREIYNKYKNNREKKNDPNAKISYRKLAKKYGVSHTLIKGIITGEFRNKENYIIK